VDRHKKKSKQRRRRQRHVRQQISGTPERPRLAVFRSLKHIYAQVIDDTAGKTLTAASSQEIKDEVSQGGNRQAAVAVGKRLAEKAMAAGVSKVSFDRRHYKFHGRVKELAEAARAAGLKF
jgi:large subunit ribosomal protein L18